MEEKPFTKVSCNNKIDTEEIFFAVVTFEGFVLFFSGRVKSTGSILDMYDFSLDFKRR